MKQNGIRWPENAQTERLLAGRKMAAAWAINQAEGCNCEKDR